MSYAGRESQTWGAQRAVGEDAFRGGRRRQHPPLADALSPLNGRLADADLRRLINAIAAAVGIEAFVWLTDRAGLTPAEAAETMRWSAAAMLRSLVVGAGRAGP